MYIMATLVTLLAFGIGYFFGDHAAYRRFNRVLEQVNAQFVDALNRVLTAPIYIANQPAEEPVEGDVCPDCGEVHDDNEDPDPEVN